MKAIDTAKTIAAARLAEIERRQAALLELSPQLVADAKNFKAVFGCCIVRNVRALNP